MTDYLRDRSHLLLAGVTGSRTSYGGKTGVATWWADTWGSENFDVVLFYDAKGDSNAPQFADATASSVDDAARAVEQGSQFIVLRPRTADWDVIHARLEEFVRWLPTEMQKAVVHDEAPEYDDDPLQSFVRVHGNGANCKSIVIAQSPGDLSKKVRRQCILVWVGPTTGEEQGIFRANKRIAHYDWIDENHEPYMWSVMTGPAPEDRDTYSPVPAEYA